MGAEIREIQWGVELITEADELRAQLIQLVRGIENEKNYYACFPCAYQDSIVASYLLNKMLVTEAVSIEYYRNLKNRIKNAQREMIQAQMNWITLHADKGEMFKKLETRNAVSSVFCCLFPDEFVITKHEEVPYE